VRGYFAGIVAATTVGRMPAIVFQKARGVVCPSPVLEFSTVK
jgi:hypothetical protein